MFHSDADVPAGGKYVSALVSELPQRNGWTLAEQAGDRPPDRMQRRAGAAGAEAGLVIAAVDETGQQKTG